MAARPTDRAYPVNPVVCAHPPLTVVAFPLTAIPPTSLRAVALLNNLLSTANL